MKPVFRLVLTTNFGRRIHMRSSQDYGNQAGSSNDVLIAVRLKIRQDSRVVGAYIPYAQSNDLN